MKIKLSRRKWGIKLPRIFLYFGHVNCIFNLARLEKKEKRKKNRPGINFQGLLEDSLVIMLDSWVSELSMRLLMVTFVHISL